ncbi:AI-2E family transporter [Halopseudomonas laoshanensis]|uniref:AI-2E family transporter n=1 Tax=Halopseudomonas laoshanensis TaxID=2268758 RepID=A0A7V7GV71_9GAMM|nr:AI-2E family transporter [Halopseudomonas laoshanensis]KAA0695917.1 AI-2E family transporter [Halopseudomonas laoshanensis]
MLKVFQGWMHRYFSDEEAVVLAVVLALGFAIIISFGGKLAPLLTGLVLAYLLQGLVTQLRRWHVPHALSVWLVFLLFLGALSALLGVVVPLVWRQITNLFNELPRMLVQWQAQLEHLPEQYPALISQGQIERLIGSINGELGQFGQWVLSQSLASLPMLVTILVYLVLVPILVFFFLMDNQKISSWMVSQLPRERRLMTQVWTEMNQQIANYIRGKVVEILIVGAVSYICFAVLKVNYAALLAVVVGLSVLVPYIGATVATIPVALIGLFQWGLGNEFMVLMIVYAVIQALDGNVLVPILFSEAVNLHPVAIIAAILIFGGLWGFWGIFFAIPLATLFKAVLYAWPRGVGAAHEAAPVDHPGTAEQLD